jgi:hypothetical protein
MERRLSLIDRLLADTQNALGTVFGAPTAERGNPAEIARMSCSTTKNAGTPRD